MSASAAELLAQHQAARRAEENAVRLASCERAHAFVLTRDSDGRGIRYQIWRCTLCRGVINGRDRVWYERGLRDGQRQPVRR